MLHPLKRTVEAKRYAIKFRLAVFFNFRRVKKSSKKTPTTPNTQKRQTSQKSSTCGILSRLVYTRTRLTRHGDCNGNSKESSSKEKNCS